MKQGATGFLKIKIDDVIKIDEVNSIIFTVTTPDRDLQFKKSYPDDVAYEDGYYYYIPLFQQDTVNMEGVYKIEAQINMKNAEVVKTTINKLFINSSLNTTMLDSNPSFRQIGSLVDMKVEGIAIGRDGKNGATFTPIMAGTVLSWENDKGLENPQPVDLKGEKGDKGDPYTESQEFKDYYKKVKDTVNKSEQIDKDITDKSNAFNENYDSKLSSFNKNSVNKTNDFDTNAETKTNEFNGNATNKTTAFNQNAVEKTNTFNQNAEQQHDSLAEDFTGKMNDLNESYDTKMSGLDTKSIGYKEEDITEYTGEGQTSISYRGVENFWGNIWKLIEGLRFWGNTHMLGGQPYICKDFNYTENKHSDNYESVGFTLPNSNGYIKAMGYDKNFDWLFIHSKVGGDSSKPVGDYAYVTLNLNDYRVALLGGRWFDGSRAGGFCWNCNDDVGTRHRAISGRLVYIPNLKNW